ncbi:MAG: methylmalonyl-CoA mutase, partial [Flavobacteriaceae bacterium]|nr:methylmalonyl-CoA mutase [Flavobacteriaceae bacterium]
MSEFLFDEFDKVSAKRWKQKIQVDLKGADYNETLVWQSNEGINIKPFYHQDEYEALEIPQFTGDTSVCQSIFISDESAANFLAKDALKRGAHSIEIEASKPFDLYSVLKDVNLSPTQGSLHFKLHFLNESFLYDLIDKTKDVNVFLNMDLIGNLAQSGNWFHERLKDHQILADVIQKSSQITNVLSIDTSLYQNAGAHCVQQIAYGLAHANEYLNFFISNDVISKEHPRSIQFNFSVGGNYFFEIAKLRAFRYLWSLLCDEYQLDIEPHLLVKPSLRNKTIYDYNTNMLRTTTECMSALLGGANTISNSAYDGIYHKKNEFGERIARNQLLILQEESYFKKAASFADGSYYIEYLTTHLAEKALKVFKSIEKSGGFLKQLLDGTIQRKISESAEKEQKLFDDASEVLLGTNKHPNVHDKMKEELEIYPFVPRKPRKT